MLTRQMIGMCTMSNGINVYKTLKKNTAGGLTFPFVMNVVYNAGDYSLVLKTYYKYLC